MADHKAGESNVTLDVAEGHKGVTTVEATHRVFGKYSKWALFIRQVILMLYQPMCSCVLAVWVWPLTSTPWTGRRPTCTSHGPHPSWECTVSWLLSRWPRPLSLLLENLLLPNWQIPHREGLPISLFVSGPDLFVDHFTDKYLMDSLRVCDWLHYHCICEERPSYRWRKGVLFHVCLPAPFYFKSHS